MSANDTQLPTEAAPTSAGDVSETAKAMAAENHLALVEPAVHKGGTAVKDGPTKAKPAGAPKNPGMPVQADLSSPDVYLNRELTWLQFNRRVLTEAKDTRLPILERLKFLAITGSNLDEFFMKRIGGLKQQVGAGVHDLTVDGRTPAQQIEECLEVITELQEDMQLTYGRIRDALIKQDILMVDGDDYANLPEADQKALRNLYMKIIFPLITPLAMDPAHPFPFISNLSINLLVEIQETGGDLSKLIRVKIPQGPNVPRFLKIPSKNAYVSVVDVIRANLDTLFPGVDVISCGIFRVIRNSNTERDEETADDLLSMIEMELRDRKFAPIVRLEVEGGMNPVHRGMLACELGLDEYADVYESFSLLGFRDLMEVAMLDRPDLHISDHHPITHARLQDSRNIFHILRDSGSILLQHPYESFATSVERFVREASCDPKVLAIKMTLYRTSEGTKIIEYLVDAARRGKQVAVVVELKARFDEAANIRWATHLEEAGIHVTYGVLGLKTHSKTILVVRQDYDGLRRYAHIGTGNYHAGTARLYCDIGLLTCDEQIGADLTDLFNYLTTGCQQSHKYRKILTTPKVFKKAMIKNIAREAGFAEQGRPGLIRLKTNALEDSDIVKALYTASQAGVKIELIVRDTCRLIPGLPGLSENITVISVIGQFLEHARIYHFRNGGHDEYFIGSADLMRRNLESRVEVITPIEDKAHQSELNHMLKIQLKDMRNVWDMQSDGTYTQRRPGPAQRRLGSQTTLIRRAVKRSNEANKLRKRLPRGFARRVSR